MNTEKRINEAMKQIETRIKQKQKDIKESQKCLTTYKEDKITCAYNRMAIVCWQEEINALEEIYITLKAREIRVTFYDLNEKEFIENKHLNSKKANYVIINTKTQTLSTWYKETAGITLHKVEGFEKNWYYYVTDEGKIRYVEQVKEEYQDEYGSWQPIE